MAIAPRLENLLEKSRVHYEIITHPVAYTAQELAALEHVSGKRHAKVVLIDADGDRVMAVVPADQRVDLRRFEQVVGKPCDLASEEEFTRLFPDCARGTMPPFGSLYNMPMYMDRSLTTDGYIVFEAGTHTDAIRMKYTDFERLAKPKIAEFTERAHATYL